MVPGARAGMSPGDTGAGDARAMRAGQNHV
jgi:hypothetical protein